MARRKLKITIEIHSHVSIDYNDQVRRFYEETLEDPNNLDPLQWLLQLEASAEEHGSSLDYELLMHQQLTRTNERK